ncbi:hypothetical protein Tco_0417764, partial [Tanacetum coccineum]
ILLDHLLSYALTATADVPAVYLQQFCKNNTQDNPFVAPVNIEIIESFIHTVGYQGVVDKWDFMNCVSQKKDVIEYPRFTKPIIVDLMKKFPSIPSRLEEDYHSVKDDIPLEIHATDDYKESTPRAYKIHTLTTSPQGKKRKQSAGETSSPRKSLKVTIKQKQVVEGEKDEESYADKFAASMIHDDDFRDRIEPGSHKEHPEVFDVDDDNKEEKKDEKKDDEMGSLENRTEKMQTPIPTTPKSPRINLSSDKNIAQELMDTV